MTTCLVTGASGFLGGRLAATLSADGLDVLAVSRCPLKGFRTILSKSASVDLDLSSAECSEVYHLAGLAHFIPRTSSDNDRFFEVNVEATRGLLRALDRANALPQSVTFVSSVSVYGADSGELLDEETPRRATDPYGASKRAAEDLLWEWGDRRGVRIGIARLPLVVGKGAPGNLGTMMRAMKSRRYFGVGSGTARRSMVLVNDVARALRGLAATGGVFHFTDGCHPSFREFEAAMARALGRRAPLHLPLWVASLGARIGDGLERVTGLRPPLNSRALAKMTTTLTFSDRRARNRLGWNPFSVVDNISEIFG